MATIVGPLLLVLLGIGGLVVVFGRRLKDIRTELAVPSHAGDRAVVRRVGQGVARGALAVGRMLLVALRGVVWILRLVGRGAGRLLQRPPAVLRVPRIAFPSVRRARVPGGRSAKEVASPPAPAHQGAADWPVAAPAAADVARTDEDAEALTRAREKLFEELASAGMIEPSADQESPPLAGAPPLAAEESPAEPVAGASVDELLARGSREEPVAAATTPPESPPAAVTTLETHVEEERVGRRKIVGRVRRSRAPAGRKASAPAAPAAQAEEEELASVEKLIARGQLARAEQVLIEALAANPRDLAAYRLLGRVYLERGDPVQATEVLEEALRRDPEEPAVYGLLGNAYDSRGQYGKALQMYQRAHDADEKNVAYLERLLAIASRMDRRPLVKVTAEKILALAPTHADAKKHLARVTVG